MKVKYLIVDQYNKIIWEVPSFDEHKEPEKRDMTIFCRVAILAVALVLLAGVLLLLTGAGRAEAQGPEVEEVNAAEIVRVVTMSEEPTIAEGPAAVGINQSAIAGGSASWDALAGGLPAALPVEDRQSPGRPANPNGVPLFDEELAALYETAEAWHFNPDLGLALIWVESRYDREAVNEDCYGLCQLKERYFPGASDMTGAENIRAGLTYLGKLLAEYDNLDAALTAYRWGHDNGDRTYAAEGIGKLEELAMECY